MQTIGSKSQVYKGHAKHTSGGLKKKDILRILVGKVKKGKHKGKKRYRYVSKKRSQRAKRLYKDGLMGVTNKGLGAYRRRTGQKTKKGSFQVVN